MLAEYLEDKNRLLGALEKAGAALHERTSVYALLETDDPAWPFEIALVSAQGSVDDQMKLVNERLFGRAFLDYGFHEVLDENSIEGTVYAPIEELFSDDDCIGVAPVSFFDADAARARMARGADEDEDDDSDAVLDSQRFAHFLKAVSGKVVDGQPAGTMTYDDTERVRGLIFKYDTGAGAPVVAFQRVQPMWVQQKSSLLLFTPEGNAPEVFAARSLKMGTAFDFVLYEDTLYFRSLKALEILFKYRKLVAQQAKDYADTLEPIVADFEKLDERIDKSRAVANKLLKLQQEGSPVADMDPTELEGRVGRIPYYNRKVHFNEQGKVMLTTDTNVSDFIRMLQDTLLVSPLSSSKYEAKSKKLLDSEEL